MRCKVAGCVLVEWAAGFCSKHYERQRRTGSIEDGPRARATLEVRLWRQIDRRGAKECWPWTAKSLISGYGTISRGGRDAGKVFAHRAVWELEKGPIPESGDYHGMVVMHTCDNRLCCNPRHLILGRQADNVRDMDLKGRRVSKPPIGEKHHNAKLTEADVKAIRASSESNAEIAKRYGVTQQNVRYIRAKKGAWKHVC